MKSNITLCGLLTLGLLGAIVRADYDSGSDGSDGSFNPMSNVEIDLGLAATATWDTPSPVAGQGVYDPEQWAVVFKYTTIDIPAGVTVTFKNHRSGAPVVWLAQGSVNVAGGVYLRGETGHLPYEQPFYTEPGPGGFEGAPVAGSAGFGPGGGRYLGPGYGANGASFQTSGIGASATYGNPWLTPLIGGSGGNRSINATGGGGAGGGALLIASGSEIAIASTGAILCPGGYGDYGASGSGGAIRLVADTVSGSGVLQANGGAVGYGYGWIRIEANDLQYSAITSPMYTFGAPGSIFPSPQAPTLRAVRVSGIAVPADPDMGIQTPDVDIDQTDATTIEIEATNIPVGTTVQVRIVPQQGPEVIVTSTPLVDAGNGLLTATATATFPQGPSEVQLRANW